MNFEYATSHAAALILSVGEGQSAMLRLIRREYRHPLCQFDTSFRITNIPRDSCLYL